MADVGRGRAVSDTADAPVLDGAASAADLQEQRRTVLEDPEDALGRFSLPAEASEADAVEQMRSEPLDDDDRR